MSPDDNGRMAALRNLMRGHALLDNAGRVGFLGIVVLIGIALTVAIALSHDILAATIGSAALAVSLLNLWRAEFRGPEITALLVDHPTTLVAGNALAVHFQVSQPLVVENVGGSPSVLAGVELIDPMWGGGNWWSVGVAIEDTAVPRVLRAREPVIARLVLDMYVYGTSPQGERYDLAEAMEELREVTATRGAVRLIYTAGGRTRQYRVEAALSSVALAAAFSQAQDRARYGEATEPDLKFAVMAST